MHANLVRPTGVKVSPQEVCGVESRKSHKSRPRRPPRTDDRHALSVSWIPGNRLLDRDPLTLNVSPAQGSVAPDNLASGHGAAEEAMRPVRLGDEEQPRRLLVQAVDDPLALLPAQIRERTTAAFERIDQRAAPVPG